MTKNSFEIFFIHLEKTLSASPRSSQIFGNYTIYLTHTTTISLTSTFKARCLNELQHSQKTKEKFYQENIPTYS